VGNKPLKRSFWLALAEQGTTPCKTCAHFEAWIQRPYGRWASCDLGKWCFEPDEGCERWMREPGSDDDS